MPRNTQICQSGGSDDGADFQRPSGGNSSFSSRKFNTGKPALLPRKTAGREAARVISMPSVNVRELRYEPVRDGRLALPYRDAICSLCEHIVSVSLAVPLDTMRAKTRSSAEAALARQTAMYLCHTVFSLMHTEVGLYFKRDRTTVSHACRLIEDKRDEQDFDLMISQLEGLLFNAQYVSDLQILHADHVRQNLLENHDV